MEFREFTITDLKEASKLLAQRHEKERQIFPILNPLFIDHKNTKKVLKTIIQNDLVKGIVAIKEDKLVGYLLANIDIENPRGRTAIISYPGLAIAQSEDVELYRLMFKELSHICTKFGVLSYTITIPAGSDDLVKAWLHLCFAFEQVYGLRSIEKTSLKTIENIDIRLADSNDSNNLERISNLIFSTQAKAPTFAFALPERMNQIRIGYGELPNDPESILFVAYQNNELVGFQCANIEDNSLNMMAPLSSYDLSISGTIPTMQQRGLCRQLTYSLMNKMNDLGYQNVCADWRISNLQSSVCWPHLGFVPYAYRLVRKIDEKIYWADGLNELG